MKRKDFLKRDWLESHLNQVKSKAGTRYTPELNIDLPISEIFDGISRTEKFYQEVRKNYGELLREFRYLSSIYKKRSLQVRYEKIKKEVRLLCEIIEDIKEYGCYEIPWSKIESKTKLISKKLWELSDKLQSEKEKVKETKAPPKKDGSYQRSPSEKISSDIHHISETQDPIRYFEQLAKSSKAYLSNQPFLLLTGLPGNGKTHLLCDLVEHRVKNSLPSVLLFGDNFSNSEDFWKQVLKQLGLEKSIKTRNDLLARLDLEGKRAKCRALFIIDALNENTSHAPDFWKKNLGKIVKEIARFPNVALVVSVRNGYEDQVLTKKQEKLFTEEEHHGFRFKEWEAVNTFFKAFSLPLPEVPLLMPEFQSPLFLLLFCRAFKKSTKKDKQAFRGHEGATYIFESYVDKVSEEIENEFGISHGPKKNIWDTVIKKIAEEMVEHSSDRISEEKLVEIIQISHPAIDTGKFIQALQTNMLIFLIPKSLGDEATGFEVRFPFQKFSDHLIGRYIFKKFEKEVGKQGKSITNARKFFSKRRKLGKFLSRSYNRGIIEALSVQCPEQLRGVEFIEVASFLTKKDDYLFQMTSEAFVESLIWRNPKAFSPGNVAILKIINERVILTKSGHDKLLDAFLSVAPMPDHALNALFLHRHLLKFSMAKRDSWWSSFLHYQYGEHGAVDRLLEWAWSDNEKSHISDDSVFLASITLSWFLTTPNRFVRDKATKGLVCLLKDRIELIPKLLGHFENVNDPYITERLFAVAYGAVLQNQREKRALKTLAEWIYKNVFKKGKPPENILIRDYARGVIDVAMKRGINVKVNKKKINPPYKSVWPKRVPTGETLKEKYYPEDYFKDKTKERGFLDIWSSVMHNFGSLGDFGNYVVDSHLYPWSRRNLHAPEPRRKYLFENFKKTLDAKQKKLLDEAINQFSGISLAVLIKEFKNTSVKAKKLSEEEEKNEKTKEEKERKKLIRKFENALPKKKLDYFKKEIKPFLDDRGVIIDPLDLFDTKLAQRWIFNRVVKLGYDPKLHGEFDSAVNRYGNSGRSEHKAERIGKKYQWIAYHEFMGLVSDHFQFKGDSWSDSAVENYQGPWTPYIRDIDPSFTLKGDSHIDSGLKLSQWKSKDGIYDGWNNKKSDKSWIMERKDLPNPKKLIKLSDDEGESWVILKGFTEWEPKIPPEHKKYDIPSRNLWYITKSYIVRKKDAGKFRRWINHKGRMGTDMPESHNFYEVFLGEYPNLRAFEKLRGNYNIWTRAGRGSNDLPVKVVVTDDIYLNEFTLDCSGEGAVSIAMPSKFLINKMGLIHSFLDGRFYDKNGNLIATPTSIFSESSPSGLLIDKKALLSFLEKNGYIIFWTILGEKQLIGGNHSEGSYIGRLEIDGLYSLSKKGNITGKMHAKFRK